MAKRFDFKKSSGKDTKEITENDNKVQDKIIFQEKPLICLIDIDEKIKENLEEKGFNVKSGTLGRAIEVPNTDNYHMNNHRCLLNFYFPPNLHEYDIIVLDLEDKGTIPYKVEEHTRKYVEGTSDTFVLSEYPETRFDPKPYGSRSLGHEIENIKSHQIFLIIFAAEEVIKEYHTAKITNSGQQPGKTVTYSNYFFCPIALYSSNKTGKEMIVQKVSNKLGLYDLLNRHIIGATYKVIFKNPQFDKVTETFIPLIKNSHDEIISFSAIYNNYVLFVFPQITEKSSFLDELLTNQLQTICPTIFPFSSEFKWLEEEAYMLPNEENLLEQRKSLIKRFEEEIESKVREIESNHQKYQCLHHLLTESGDKLVEYVKTYLEWLGFENVKVMSEKRDGKLEEDLQVETEEGLLVIEVKGIDRTSKDEECSQIEKIKNRRIKERQSFDVFGIYIVNHQRHRPPSIRENPPFKEQQIKDAENEERGLLTTWQLFNLYYSIKNDGISKEEAREAFFKHGLIEFLPTNCIPLDKPERILHDGEVIILNLSHKVNNDDELIIKRGERYIKTKILEIRVNDQKVESVDSGPVGIKVQVPIKKSDGILLKEES